MEDFLFENIGLIIPAVILVCAIAVWLMFRTRDSKVFSSKARVKAKDIKRPVDSRFIRRSFVNTGLSGCCPLECFITWELENGKEIELQCTSEVYKLINEGDEGVLTRDRHYFISFEKND